MDIQFVLCRKMTLREFSREKFRSSDDILAVVSKGCMSVEDAAGPWSVHPLEAFCFRSDTDYERHVTEPLEIYFFRFRSEDHPFPQGTMSFRDGERIRSTLAAIDRLENSVGTDDYACREHLFFDLLLQYQLEKGIFDPALTTDSIAGEAAREIRDRMGERLNLAMLSKKYGLSYVHFARRFKAAVGAPPSVYLTRVRLRKACELLGETELPLREIAPICGFGTEFYLAAFFKEHTGSTPGEYREAVKSL